jgi:GAF domain-containing protein
MVEATKDATAMVEYGAAAKERAYYLDVLIKMMDGINSELDIDATIREIVHVARTLINCERLVALLFTEPDNLILVVLSKDRDASKALFGAEGGGSTGNKPADASSDTDDDLDEEVTISVEYVSHSIIADVIASGQSVNIANDGSQSVAQNNKLMHTFEILASLGVTGNPLEQKPRSLLCVPIKGAQGEVMGVIQAVNSFAEGTTAAAAAAAAAAAVAEKNVSGSSASGNSSNTAFTQTDVRLLRHLAQHAGITIGKARLLERSMAAQRTTQVL